MIKIITDSTCDIPENLLEQYDISVVPQVVTWGDEQYRDRVDLKPSEFYQRLETNSTLPHSSQPTIIDFQNVYESALSRGADQLIVITVSSAMSGTYNIAQTVAESFNERVTVVDSKGPTMSLGWQVLAAARAIEKGADLKSILNRIDQVRKKLILFVGMNTLKYLQKGGRIGKAAKWTGTILNVKPLVSINHQTGLVEPVGLVRTYKALIDTLYHKFFNQISGGKNMRIAVLHGNVLKEAQALAEQIKAEYNPLELLINTTGPVLGINTGPGALALCGYAED